MTGPEQWTARVPNKIVDAILSPGSCLVVGDAPGDPDCFCSAVGLARARQYLGLEAKAYVASQPPKQIRDLIREGEIIEDPQTVQPETVIVVDNDGSRVGSAALEAMRQAKRVVIMDHHSVFPTKEKLGLPEEVELIVWNEMEADAAALLVLASTIRAVYDRGHDLSEEVWADITLPLVAAMYSDTRGFEASRTHPNTLLLLKQLVDTGSINLSKLAGLSGGISSDIREWMCDQITETKVQHGDQKLGIFTLDAPTMQEAWSRAREEMPDLTWSDVLFVALDFFETKTRIQDLDVALFAVGAQDGSSDPLDEQQAQVPNGAVKFSVRTKQGSLAPNLAKFLGGEGKLHEGGGVTNESIADIEQKARKWLERQGQLAYFATGLNMGGL